MNVSRILRTYKTERLIIKNNSGRKYPAKATVTSYVPTVAAPRPVTMPATPKPGHPSTMPAAQGVHQKSVMKADDGYRGCGGVDENFNAVITVFFKGWFENRQMKVFSFIFPHFISLQITVLQ